MSGSAILVLMALGLAAAQNDSTSPPAEPAEPQAVVQADEVPDPEPVEGEEGVEPDAVPGAPADEVPDPEPVEGEAGVEPDAVPGAPADGVPDPEPVEGEADVIPDAVSGAPAGAPSEIEGPVIAPSPPPERPSVLTGPSAAPRRRRRPEAMKSGLFGWGLGLEIPTFGVMTGMGKLSRPGWGYWLAGALSWEVTPKHLVRLYGSAGQTYGARAGVRYLDSVNTQTEARSGQSAEWLGMEAGIGGVYLFRSVDRAWTPFVGGDLGYAFLGYDFTFDDALEEIEAIDTGDAFRQCLDPECRSDQHDGLAFGFVGTLRLGMRLELTR
ncbi:MAG: hypothetical protein V3T05_04585, partial [Myxococcota bacterium]